MNTPRNSILDSIHLTWTIASKDIVESLRNKLIMSMIVGLGLMLLMPKLLGLILVPQEIPVLVYDPGESRLTTELEQSDHYQVQKVRSIAEMEQMIGSTGFGLGANFGLAIPEDLDLVLAAGGQLELDGYVAWANRVKASQLKLDFEDQIERMLEQPVRINIEGNIVFPPSDSGLWLLLVTLTPVVVILMLGMQLVPTLLFEEKQTKTMAALLVSPAGIVQIVSGKALAGLFYVFIAAGVVFVINFSAVVHWEVVLLFMLGIGVFSVGVGLVLGSFFERQQDVAGLTMLLIVVFIGALFAHMMDLDIPTILSSLISQVPSVKLAEVLKASYLETANWREIFASLGSVLFASVLLYVLVIWKVRQSDS